MIRPAAWASLHRWRELIAAGAVIGIGLWIFRLGGPVLAAIGLGAMALGAGLGVSGWRRLRFVQDVAAPGLVEVIEGEVRYFGPTFGGAVSLADLTELRLITMRGRRLWRLKQADGQALLIPIDAAGADSLFDGFTALPGLEMSAVLAALGPRADPWPGAAAKTPAVADQPDMVVVWHRKGRGLMT